MTLKKLKENSHELSPAKARIIARCIGDGAVYKNRNNYTIKYEVKDISLLKQFERDILAVYGLKVSWFKNYSGKTGELLNFVNLNSKLAYKDLHKYSSSYFSNKWTLPKQIKKANKTIIIEFLKALFDDEGSVINSKNKEIRLYSINRKGLIQINTLLASLSIECKINGTYGSKKNVYAIIIRGENIRKYALKIGFNSKEKQRKLINLVRAQGYFF